MHSVTVTTYLQGLTGGHIVLDLKEASRFMQGVAAEQRVGMNAYDIIIGTSKLGSMVGRPTLHPKLKPRSSATDVVWSKNHGNHFPGINEWKDLWK